MFLTQYWQSRPGGYNRGWGCREAKRFVGEGMRGVCVSGCRQAPEDSGAAEERGMGEVSENSLRQIPNPGMFGEPRGGRVLLGKAVWGPRATD